MKFTQCILMSLLCVSTPAFSKGDPLQLNPQSPWYGLDASNGWHFDLGVGVGYEPTYAGSNDYSVDPELLARAYYRTDNGHRYYIGLGQLGATYSLSPNTQIQAFLEYEEGREADDDKILKGLDPVDSTVEGQFTLARRFGNSAIFATLQPDLTGNANKGLVWFVGGSHDWMSDSNKWRLGTHLDISGADAEYMKTEFGITAAESQRTGYAKYIPSSGLKSATLGVSAEYFLNKKLSILGSVDLEHYLSEASDSPLIKDFGSDTTVESSLLLRWRF